jgi:hypothetical protein
MVEPAGLGETMHPDCKLDGGAGAVDLRVIRWADDGHDREIELRRKAAVETQFSLATEPPLFERAVVEKGQDDRLLDLVGKVARQQQPGGVRLDEFDPGRRMG